MSSILNSILSGDLQVQQVPGEIPVKEDSIIDLLQNSEIEFKTCPNPNSNLDNFNTGFGENNELHYDVPCKSELKLPLFKENYLREFVTEEEKSEVRKALGIYTKGDLITSAAVTLDDSRPTLQDILKASVKQIKKSEQLFAPATITKAVFHSDGTDLKSIIDSTHKIMLEHSNTLSSILEESKSKYISSLGDVNKFLQGFNNGDNLKDTITSMSNDMVRFEYGGIII